MEETLGESPLQLRHTMVRRLELVVHPNVQMNTPMGNEQFSATFEAGFTTLNIDEMTVPPSHAPFFTRIGMTLASSVGLARFERLGFAIDGFFTIPLNVNPESVDSGLLVNCLAILYGIGRGLVLSVTATMPGGPFNMPSIDIGEHYQRTLQANNATVDAEVLLIRQVIEKCRRKYTELIPNFVPPWEPASVNDTSSRSPKQKAQKTETKRN